MKEISAFEKLPSQHEGSEIRDARTTGPNFKNQVEMFLCLSVFDTSFLTPCTWSVHFNIVLSNFDTSKKKTSRDKTSSSSE